MRSSFVGTFPLSFYLRYLPTFIPSFLCASFYLPFILPTTNLLPFCSSILYTFPFPFLSSYPAIFLFNFLPFSLPTFSAFRSVSIPTYLSFSPNFISAYLSICPPFFISSFFPLFMSSPFLFPLPIIFPSYPHFFLPSFLPSCLPTFPSSYLHSFRLSQNYPSSFLPSSLPQLFFILTYIYPPCICLSPFLSLYLSSIPTYPHTFVTFSLPFILATSLLPYILPTYTSSFQSLSINLPSNHSPFLLFFLPNLYLPTYLHSLHLSLTDQPTSLLSFLLT